jgi:large subunit ribosomal protein L17
MLRNLTANLIAHERIETTDAKAKELRRVAERLISKAIRLGEAAYNKEAAAKDPARRLHVERLLRQAIPRFGVGKVGDELKKIDLVEKVLLDLAKRFAGRPGGYTRIIKVGLRRGDNAPMSVIEFVGPYEPKAKAEEAAAG